MYKKSLLGAVCLVALSTAVFPPLSYSGIYQCNDQDGRTTFSDQPCKSGIVKQIEAPKASSLVAFVSGRITHNDDSFPIRHGVALWFPKNLEMKLYLTKHPITDTQRQMAMTNDMTFLEAHKPLGVAEIVLTFKNKAVSLDNLRTMKSSYYGLNAKTIEAPRTSYHGGNDVIGHVHKLKQETQGNQRWITFASQEMTPDIRWNINLVIPVNKVQEKAH